MPNKQEIAETGRELGHHHESMGFHGDTLWDPNITNMDLNNSATVAGLAMKLSDPRHFNQIHCLFSPFPILTAQFHMYLSILAIEEYLGDIDQLLHWDSLSLPQLISITQ